MYVKKFKTNNQPQESYKTPNNAEDTSETNTSSDVEDMPDREQELEHLVYEEVEDRECE